MLTLCLGFEIWFSPWMDDGRPGGGGGPGGRLRTAALVGGRCAVRFLGYSLRACAPEAGQLGCLRLSRRPPIAPEFPACVAPVACSPLIWSPGGRSPQPPALKARSETRQGSRRRWPSGLLWPISSPTPSHRSAICGRRTPESVLHAVATARTTTRLFQDILRRGHR